MSKIYTFCCHEQHNPDIRNIISIKASDEKELHKKILNNYDKFDEIMEAFFTHIENYLEDNEWDKGTDGKPYYEKYDELKKKSSIDKLTSDKTLRYKFLKKYIKNLLQWFPFYYYGAEDYDQYCSYDVIILKKKNII